MKWEWPTSMKCLYWSHIKYFTDRGCVSNKVGNLEWHFIEENLARVMNTPKIYIYINP